MRRKHDDLVQELQARAEQMSALHAELQAHGGDSRSVERLRAKLARQEEGFAEERAATHRTLDKHKKEVGPAPRRALAPLVLGWPMMSR